VGLLEAGFRALNIDPDRAQIEPMPDGRRAGFLAIRMRDAVQVARALHDRCVFVDARGEILRVGPAPYLSDDQLRSAVVALHEVLVA
jgi:kynureninase